VPQTSQYSPEGFIRASVVCICCALSSSMLRSIRRVFDTGDALAGGLSVPLGGSGLDHPADAVGAERL
jgi:hypothetical protein